MGSCRGFPLPVLPTELISQSCCCQGWIPVSVKQLSCHSQDTGTGCSSGSFPGINAAVQGWNTWLACASGAAVRNTFSSCILGSSFPAQRLPAPFPPLCHPTVSTNRGYRGRKIPVSIPRNLKVDLHQLILSKLAGLAGNHPRQL